MPNADCCSSRRPWMKWAIRLRRETFSDLHDLVAAHEVIEAILNEFPPSGYAQRGLLLFAQAVDEMGDPAEARNVFRSARSGGGTRGYRGHSERVSAQRLCPTRTAALRAGRG